MAAVAISASPDGGLSTVATVVRYRPEFRPVFASLNRRWIETLFAIEPRDEAVLNDPEGEIIAQGGDVFFLLDGTEHPVGTCALIPARDSSWYLTKMAVDPAVQGRGYGELLLRAAVEWARAQGGSRVTLTSNRRLAPALALYRKHGFHEVPLEPEDAGYARVDIRMELAL
jgi:putative acetyltransferase